MTDLKEAWRNLCKAHSSFEEGGRRERENALLEAQLSRGHRNLALFKQRVHVIQSRHMLSEDSSSNVLSTFSKVKYLAKMKKKAAKAKRNATLKKELSLDLTASPLGSPREKAAGGGGGGVETPCSTAAAAAARTPRTPGRAGFGGTSSSAAATPRGGGAGPSFGASGRAGSSEGARPGSRPGAGDKAAAVRATTPKHVFWDQETSAPHHTLGAMRSALLATQKTLKSMGSKVPQADLPAFTPLHFTLPPLPAEEQRAVAAEVKRKLPWEAIARRTQDVSSAESLYSTAPQRPARAPTSIAWRNGLPSTGSPAASPSGRDRAPSKTGGGSREGRRPGSRGGSSRGGGSRAGRPASVADNRTGGGGGADGCGAGAGAGAGDAAAAGPGREMFVASLQAPEPGGEGAPMAYAFPMPGEPPSPGGVDAGAGAKADAGADAAPAPSAPPSFGEDLRDGLCDLPEKDSYSRKEVLQARMQHSKQIHRLQASFEERLQKMHAFYQQQIESAQTSAAARAGSPRVKYRQQRVPEGRQVRLSSHMFLPPKFSGMLGGRGG